MLLIELELARAQSRLVHSYRELVRGLIGVHLLATQA